MVYTLPESLRDREYQAHTAIQLGSVAGLGVVVSGTALITQWTGTGSVVISGVPSRWSGIGSTLLCGQSGTTIIALRCLNDGTLLVSGI